jgi:hypothetical protein
MRSNTWKKNRKLGEIVQCREREDEVGREIGEERKDDRKWEGQEAE